jgi:hypothetical protein
MNKNTTIEVFARDLHESELEIYDYEVPMQIVVADHITVNKALELLTTYKNNKFGKSQRAAIVYNSNDEYKLILHSSYLAGIRLEQIETEIQLCNGLINDSMKEIKKTQSKLDELFEEERKLKKKFLL